MISVQPSTKFLCNTQFALKYREQAAIFHWDGRSSAVGRDPTCYSVWFSQGQINAIISFSHVPHEADFCLDIVASLSLFFLSIFLKLFFWPQDCRLKFIFQWCPGGPACPEKASKLSLELDSWEQTGWMKPVSVESVQHPQQPWTTGWHGPLQGSEPLQCQLFMHQVWGDWELLPAWCLGLDSQGLLGKAQHLSCKN